MSFVTISIHALRVEGDCCHFNSSVLPLIFLSTPSGWRATRGATCAPRPYSEISIHALRVEGDPQPRQHKESASISIHALRVEGDIRFKRGLRSS